MRYTTGMKRGIPLRQICALLLILTTVGSYAIPIRAATISDLQKQQKALEDQAKQKAAAAAANQALADQAATTIQRVTGQITKLQTNISSTQSDIADTQSQMDTLDQQLTNLQNQITSAEEQETTMLQGLYMLRESMPDGLVALFANETISEGVSQQQQ